MCSPDRKESQMRHRKAIAKTQQQVDLRPFALAFLIAAAAAFALHAL